MMPGHSKWYPTHTLTHIYEYEYANDDKQKNNGTETLVKHIIICSIVRKIVEKETNTQNSMLNAFEATKHELSDYIIPLLILYVHTSIEDHV